jgi:hypothetical protein
MEMCLRGSGVLILSICMLLCGVGFCVGYGGGTGDPGTPYLISMDAHLQELSANITDWNLCFKLVADVNATSYTPITSFKGVFDGNGYSISEFSCTTGTSYVGFFCKVEGATARVKNLNLISPTVNVPTASNVGGIAGGVISGAVISGCSVIGGSITGYNVIGGLVGANSGTMNDCFASATVSGNSQAGGVAGLNDQGYTVSRSRAEGDVTARTTGVGTYSGGLIGLNKGTVTECVATGNVTGLTYVGGLAGANGSTSPASNKIQWSYASGLVTGTSYVGGLVGWNDPNPIVNMCYSSGHVDGGSSNVGGLIGKSRSTANITKSFWDTTTSGQSGSSGGTGKATVDMQKISTFTVAGVVWDFLGETTNGTADIWRMCVDGVDYPGLQWEWPKGDISCPDGVDFVDFAVLAANWGLAGTGLKGDLNGSGAVDIVDLAIFAADWMAGVGGGLPG